MTFDHCCNLCENKYFCYHWCVKISEF
jgi:hypothetical protein